jgi:hypothetical protein
LLLADSNQTSSSVRFRLCSSVSDSIVTIGAVVSWATARFETWRSITMLCTAPAVLPYAHALTPIIIEAYLQQPHLQHTNASQFTRQ